MEHGAQAEALGLPRRFPAIGPQGMRGIEFNSYTAELARVWVWIGGIQWMLMTQGRQNRKILRRG